MKEIIEMHNSSLMIVMDTDFATMQFNFILAIIQLLPEIFLNFLVWFLFLFVPDYVNCDLRLKMTLFEKV